MKRETPKEVWMLHDGAGWSFSFDPPTASARRYFAARGRCAVRMTATDAEVRALRAEVKQWKTAAAEEERVTNSYIKRLHAAEAALTAARAEMEAVSDALTGSPTPPEDLVEYVTEIQEELATADAEVKRKDAALRVMRRAVGLDVVRDHESWPTSPEKVLVDAANAAYDAALRPPKRKGARK